MAENDGEEPRLLPPTDAATSSATQILLAEVRNYTDRPDLFLETIETHDPGFIKRLNADAEKHAEKLRTSTFNFGRFQAYAVLFVQVVLSFATISVLAVAVIYNQAGATTIISLGVVLAIILSGPSGFGAIAQTIERWLTRRPKDD
jgi:hypothetical protein